MRGEVLASETDGDRVCLNALVPVAESMDYAVTLAAATGGRGAMSVRLHSWQPCPLELGAQDARWPSFWGLQLFCWAVWWCT